MYQTQDFARKGDDVAAKKTAQKIITDFPHSAVAEDAYIALATAQTDLGMSVDALATYRALEKRASGSVVLNTARLGILRTARDLGYADVMLEAADNLLASSTVGANSREEVLFAKKMDEYDVYRDMFNEAIEDRIVNGRQGIEQELYVTIRYDNSPSYENAKSFFGTLENNMIQAYRQIGSELKPLDATERLRILHDFYRFGKEEYFHFDFRNAVQWVNRQEVQA